MSYKRLTKWSDVGTLHIFGFCGQEIPLSEATELNIACIARRLAALEDKIESGEIDYVADSETGQTITDLLIEFDEMGFAPTTVCPNAEQYAIDWRDRVRKEFARLTEQEKQAVETLTRSFTRMETLYKVKCTEIEAKEEEISDLKAENAERDDYKSRAEVAEQEATSWKDCANKWQKYYKEQVVPLLEEMRNIL